ncbi:MAG: hypothetical protein LC803_19720 [Acidobacteria bacterium]|nr:hypothetical protein [Acidobacteriota bacterium]
MAARTPPSSLGVEERLHQLEERLAALDVSKPWFATFPTWVLNLLSGLSLVVVLGFAYWLGSLSTSLKQNTEKTDKLYSIVLESKDSLTARLGVIETKLDSIDRKLSERPASGAAHATGGN